METIPGFERARTLLDLLFRFPEVHAEASDREFLRYQTQFRTFSSTYRQVFHRAHQVRQFLKKEDVTPGSPVLVWGPNSPYWIWVYLGSMLHECPVVPIDVGSENDFVERVARETDSDILFRSSFVSSPAIPEKQIHLEKLPDILRGIPFRKKMTVNNNPEQLATIMYTSGTTGDPKGTLLTHENLLANLQGLQDRIDVEFDPCMAVISLLPLSHAFEQMAGFWLPASSGGRITYLRSKKPSEIFRALGKEHPNFLVTVPRLLELFQKKITNRVEEAGVEGLFRTLRTGARSLPVSMRRKLFFYLHRMMGGRLHYMVSGGAPLDSEVEDFWWDLGFEVYQGYGLTETSPVLTCNSPSDFKRGTVGKPLSNVRIRLSEKNEIEARGDSIFQGYFQKEDLTNEVKRNGWFRTGDIGKLDQDGFLEIKGRKKNVIVTGEGMNVHPEDVEDVLNQFSEIHDSCVLSYEQQVCAVLLPGEKARDSANYESEGEADSERKKRLDTIIREANQKLANHQQVLEWTVWPESDFPRTTTMKIKRNEVKERLPDLIDSSSEASTVDDAEERDPVLEILSEQSDKDPSQIALDSTLGPDLGLSSVDRLEIVMRLEERLFVDVPESQIESSTTVEDLKELVEEEGASAGQGENFRRWVRSDLIHGIRRISQISWIHPFLRQFYDLEVHGKEHLSDVDGPVIFVSNHQSHFDTPVIVQSLPHPFCHRLAPAAWAEYFEVRTGTVSERLWKWATWEMTTIFFNIFPVPQSRGTRQSLQYLGELLDHNWNVLFFPEGERTVDGTMHPFQRGVRVLVREMDVPIVPIRIDGLFHVFPRWRSWPKEGNVHVRIDDPIDPAELRKLDQSQKTVESHLWNRIQNMAMNKDDDQKRIPVTMYSKEDCPPCHDAKQQISRIAHDKPIKLETVMIEEDNALFEKYKHSVPAVYVGEQLASKGPFNERRFRRLLEEELETKNHP